jgi:hypothetical protein
LLEKREVLLNVKAIKTDIYAVRFALITLFSFETKFLAVRFVFFYKRPIFRAKNATVRYGTLRYATVRYDTLRYATIRYDTLRYATIRFGTLR